MDQLCELAVEPLTSAIEAIEEATSDTNQQDDETDSDGNTASTGEPSATDQLIDLIDACRQRPHQTRAALGRLMRLLIATGTDLAYEAVEAAQSDEAFQLLEPADRQTLAVEMLRMYPQADLAPWSRHVGDAAHLSPEERAHVLRALLGRLLTEESGQLVGQATTQVEQLIARAPDELDIDDQMLGFVDNFDDHLSQEWWAQDASAQRFSRVATAVCHLADRLHDGNAKSLRERLANHVTAAVAIADDDSLARLHAQIRSLPHDVAALVAVDPSVEREPGDPTAWWTALVLDTDSTGVEETGDDGNVRVRHHLPRGIAMSAVVALMPHDAERLLARWVELGPDHKRMVRFMAETQPKQSLVRIAAEWLKVRPVEDRPAFLQQLVERTEVHGDWFAIAHLANVARQRLLDELHDLLDDDLPLMLRAARCVASASNERGDEQAVVEKISQLLDGEPSQLQVEAAGILVSGFARLRAETRDRLRPLLQRDEVRMHLNEDHTALLTDLGIFDPPRSMLGRSSRR